LKSYDKPDEVASDEVIQTSTAIEPSENPTDIAEVETGERELDGTTAATQIGGEADDDDATEVQIEEQDEETTAHSGKAALVVEKGADLNGSGQASVVAPAAVAEKEDLARNSVATAGGVQPALEQGDLSSNPPATVTHVQPPSAPEGGFKWPSREQLIAWAPFWGVIILGVILRFWDLGAKPLHHDESLHAYYSLQLLHNLQNWGWCVGLNNPPAGYGCYQYDPLLHGPFQFHAIALVYQISQWLGAPDHGINTTTVRIMAALLGSVLVGLPYFLRDYLGKFGAWLACFLLAVSPSMVYFSRFAREDIYMACFTLLLVVSVARYVRGRQIGWLVLAAAGFALSYATSEATFLTIAIFGSFLGAVIVWELGAKLRLRALLGDPAAARYLPRTFAGVLVLVYFLILGLIAKVFFGILDRLSAFINGNQAVSNADLLNLESITVRILPWLGILLGLVVFSILALEVYGMIQPGRRGLARFVDRRRQPVLDTILTMPWTHWFFALIMGIAIFLLLFTVVFTNIAGGIGDGIWKGLYYWLEQQKVARGGQPWYYYLLLIPLYEQVGVVFAVVGIIRCLWKPNQFRLFLVYWFLGNFFIYSWAGEKMPWLMIFMTMPMLLLAAIGLEPCIIVCYHFIKERFFSAPPQPAQNVATSDQADTLVQAPWSRPRVGVSRFALGLFGVVMAVLLLLPTIHNMYEVSYVEPADGPREMMIYVQTTPDINALMAQVDAVDKKDFGGKHQMRVAVTADGVWPLAWYLRDYPNLCFNYPDACPSWVNNVPVIITGGDDYVPNATVYQGHEYKMRSWWDEGYKLPACQQGQTPSNSCSDPSLGNGVGPLLWLSYGDTPPANAKFNLGLTAKRVWNWWWNRQPFGGTDGYYPMALFIQKSMGVNP
jgi:uncharacterized protein (TIGR03663 family)